MADEVIPLSPVSATYKLTFSEFYSGYQAYSRRLLIRLMIIQLAVISAAITYGQYITQGYFLRSGYGQLVTAFGAIAIAVMPLRYRRAYRGVYNGRFGNEEINARFDESGLSFQTPTVFTALRWGGLSHFTKKREVLVMYRTRRIPYTVPKRAFASPTEFEMAARWCEERIGYASEERGFEVVPTAVEKME